LLGYLGANYSITREKAILAEFQELNAEARKRLIMNLEVDTKKEEPENKNERFQIEPPNPQSATLRSPKIFIIKHKKTDSQELSAGLKRNSIESDSNSQRASLSNNDNKSRKTSNASIENLNKQHNNGDNSRIRKALPNGEEIGAMMQGSQQKFFDSIEENKSEKSGSGSPLSAKSKALGYRASENNTRNGNHINMNKKNEISLKPVAFDDQDQFLKSFSSLDFGDTEIKIGDQIGEGKLGNYKQKQLIWVFVFFIRRLWCRL
jgi:hypothetical protein